MSLERADRLILVGNIPGHPPFPGGEGAFSRAESTKPAPRAGPSHYGGREEGAGESMAKQVAEAGNAETIRGKVPGTADIGRRGAADVLATGRTDMLDTGRPRIPATLAGFIASFVAKIRRPRWPACERALSDSGCRAAASAERRQDSAPDLVGA